jgi:DNA gyrase subunit A
MKAKYASPRRTEIIGAAGEFRMEDVIPNEGCVITVSHLGFIKRTPVADYRSRSAAARASSAPRPTRRISSRPLHREHPRLHPLPHEHRPVPREEGLRRPRGHPRLQGQVRLLLPPPRRGREDRRDDLREGFRRQTPPRHGHQERRHEEDQPRRLRQRHPRGRPARHQARGGRHPRRLRAHQRRKRESSSSPTRARPCASSEDDLRDQGRDTVGVTGMRFKIEGDYVRPSRSATPPPPARRPRGRHRQAHAFEDYRLISRGGTGVIAIDLPEDGSVNVAGALSVRDTDEVMLLTAKGQSVRTRVKEIRETGRGAKGVKLVNLERATSSSPSPASSRPRKNRKPPATAPPPRPRAKLPSSYFVRHPW